MMGRRRAARPVLGKPAMLSGLAAVGWMLLTAPAVGAQQDCPAQLAKLEESRRTVERLFQQVEAVVASLEEQLGALRERLEASEDPDERARLEELAIRLAEQIQRAQDQRDEIGQQLTTFEEAIDALGTCGR